MSALDSCQLFADVLTKQAEGTLDLDNLGEDTPLSRARLRRFNAVRAVNDALCELRIADNALRAQERAGCTS